MRFLWTSTRKDLLRHRRDPAALLLWLAIPLVMAGLIQLAFGGRGGAPPRARLLVADEDDTPLSQLLTSALDRATVIEIEPVERVAGRARIDAGKGTALLVIPDGFATAVLEQEPVTLQLITNPAQRILPGIVEESLSILVDGTFYLQQLLGDELRRMSAGPPGGATSFPDTTIIATSLTVNRLVRRLGETLFPPVIDLQFEVAADDLPAADDMGALFFPGILFMGLLFMTQGLSADIWQERSRGTLRRMLVTPQRVGGFLGGKVLAAALLLFGICLLGNVLGIGLFDLGWAHLPLAVTWSAFVGTVFFAVLLFLQAHASSERTAGILATLVLFPLLMVGGSFFPFESMPAWLARIGRWTPNGWALEQLKAILWGRVEALPLARAFVALAAVGLVAFLLGARRLRRGFVGS